MSGGFWQICEQKHLLLFAVAPVRHNAAAKRMRWANSRYPWCAVVLDGDLKKPIRLAFGALADTSLVQIIWQTIHFLTTFRYEIFFYADTTWELR